MAPTPDRNWNSHRVAGWLLLAPALALARQAHQEAAPGPEIAPPPGDTLGDALTCHSDGTALPDLLSRLRRERPDEFVQTDRQYSQPVMDLYRLQSPVQAWGNAGDAVAITANRVMLVVGGRIEDVSKRIDHELETSRDAPLPGVLDAAHALVVYPADLPGLEGTVLLGCEYRLEGLSLLDDPADAWRKTPAPALIAPAERKPE